VGCLSYLFLVLEQFAECKFAMAMARSGKGVVGVVGVVGVRFDFFFVFFYYFFFTLFCFLMSPPSPTPFHSN